MRARVPSTCRRVNEAHRRDGLRGERGRGRERVHLGDPVDSTPVLDISRARKGGSEFHYRGDLR